MNVPNRAEIEHIADDSLTAIISYGTPHGKPLNEKLSKVIRHYLIWAMIEVRNKTIHAEKDLIEKLLDDLSQATSL